jgi:hypothetical protein
MNGVRSLKPWPEYASETLGIPTFLDSSLVKGDERTTDSVAGPIDTGSVPVLHEEVERRGHRQGAGLGWPGAWWDNAGRATLEDGTGVARCLLSTQSPRPAVSSREPMGKPPLWPHGEPTPSFKPVSGATAPWAEDRAHQRVLEHTP